MVMTQTGPKVSSNEYILLSTDKMETKDVPEGSTCYVIDKDEKYYFYQGCWYKAGVSLVDKTGGKEAHAQIEGPSGVVVYASIADAIKDATSGQTIRLTKSEVGEGIDLPAGKDLTLDLNGNTYTSNSRVGSSGTQNQGYRILKGSKVIIENGTIAATNEPEMLMLFNNYGDLTLRNVHVDGSFVKLGHGIAETPADGAITLYSQCGTVTIEGDTTITASKMPGTEGKAFALGANWWPAQASYVDGTQITVDVTGKIDGILLAQDSLGSHEASDSPSKITINNAKVCGDIMIADTLPTANFEIGKMEVERGDSLNIMNGAKVTNAGTIINQGTIYGSKNLINDGAIIGDGTIIDATNGGQ